MARAAPQLRLVPAEVPAEVTAETNEDAEGTICNCHKVSEATLREAIANGADSVAALRECTRAGTGRGSCKGELGQLVSTLARKPAAALQVAN